MSQAHPFKLSMLEGLWLDDQVSPPCTMCPAVELLRHTTQLFLFFQQLEFSSSPISVTQHVAAVPSCCKAVTVEMNARPGKCGHPECCHVSRCTEVPPWPKLGAAPYPLSNTTDPWNLQVQSLHPPLEGNSSSCCSDAVLHTPPVRLAQVEP